MDHEREYRKGDGNSEKRVSLLVSRQLVSARGIISRRGHTTAGLSTGQPRVPIWSIPYNNEEGPVTNPWGLLLLLSFLSVKLVHTDIFPCSRPTSGGEDRRKVLGEE